MTTKKSLLEKYGSEEGVKAHYREIGALSKNHPNRAKGRSNTGFQILKETDPEKFIEASRKGGQSGKRGKTKTNEVA